MFENTKLYNSELKYRVMVRNNKFSVSKNMTDLVLAFKIAENISCTEYKDGTIFVNINLDNEWIVLSNKEMELIDNMNGYLIKVA